MPIAPDGRIIRRGVRQFTPVNTDNPSERIGFFLGFFSVIVVCILVVAGMSLIGWLGGLLFNLSWWNAGTFTTIALGLNLILFPIYISGALEGLAYRNEGRYSLYAFLYGFLVLAIPYTIEMLWEDGFSIWPYIWATLYGFYSIWLAGKMKK